MLKIQETLITNGLDNSISTLEENGIDYHIEKGPHNINYIHLDYGIKSNKASELVKECRGLVLRLDTFQVARMAFKRFMNYGEHGQDKIDFRKQLTYEEKLDGSLIILHYIQNHGWNCGTRGRIFPDSKILGYDITFPELFWKTFKNIDKLDTEYYYMFELCSPLNKIVIQYEKPEVFLIGMRNKNTLIEANNEFLDENAKILEVKRPKYYKFNNIEHAIKYIERSTELVEGFVLKQEIDNEFMRIKLKSSSYVALHNITSCRSLNSLIKIAIENNRGFLENGWKEYLLAYDLVINKIKEYCNEINNVFNKNKHLLDQKGKDYREIRKEFALSISSVTGKNICFMMADNKIKDSFEWLKLQNNNSGIKNLIKCLKLSELIKEGWNVVEDASSDI